VQAFRELVGSGGVGQTLPGLGLGVEVLNDGGAYDGEECRPLEAERHFVLPPIPPTVVFLQELGAVYDVVVIVDVAEEELKQCVQLSPRRKGIEDILERRTFFRSFQVRVLGTLWILRLDVDTELRQQRPAHVAKAQNVLTVKSSIRGAVFLKSFIAIGLAIRTVCTLLLKGDSGNELGLIIEAAIGNLALAAVVAGPQAVALLLPSLAFCTGSGA
jgi:hypothetical protein